LFFSLYVGILFYGVPQDSLQARLLFGKALRFFARFGVV
jgi:hypothetical protein